jgi:lipocalin-like protein
MRRDTVERTMLTSRALGVSSLVVILVFQIGAHRASGQAASAGVDAKRFVGTWRLVSDVSTGLMYYDSLGNMAAQVMPNRSRSKYAGAQPTPEEAKDAITGYLAYFGTYTVDENARTITHHRKANINPGQVGDDVVRAYVFGAGDRLILTPTGATNQIVWERAK